MMFPLAALAMSSNMIDTPFAVPVAGCLMILGIVVAGIWSGIRTREIASTERLAAIAKGVSIPPTTEELAIIHGKPSVDATRRRKSIRLGGIVLLGVAAGLIVFFVALYFVLGVREVLSGAAVGLIPLGIGVALLIDSRLQARELAEMTQTPKTGYLSPGV